MTGILNSLLKVSQKNVPSITRVHLRCYKKGLAATIGPTININGKCATCDFNSYIKKKPILPLFNFHSRWFRSSIVLYQEEDVVVPVFPESVAEGDVRWNKKVGDSVAIDEVVCEIETDKTAIPVPSPHNGVIVARYAEDGGTVKANQKIFRIKLGAAPPARTSAPVPTVKPPPKAGPPPAAGSAPAPVRKPVPPLQTPTPKPSMPISSVPKPSAGVVEIAGTRTEHRVKMTRMRQRIAQRLKEAQNENAMLTTFNEIDMSTIIAFRKLHQDAFIKKHGIKLGFMSAFIKAATYALLDQPIVNAVIDGSDIVYRDYVDISVAVASPKGLVVPVIRNVTSMNFADIEKNIVQFGEKAKKGKLSIEDMDGGTFTISNGGVFGSLLGTPIINPPQSAILGMHATVERPVAVKGQVVIKPMMYVALTYDHRLIDGREAVLFLRKIKDGVENPIRIVAGEGRGKRKATAKQCAAANLIKTITARQRKGNLAQELKPLSTDQLELAIMLMSEYLPFDEDLEIVSHDEYRKSPIYTPLINTAGNYIRCKALGLNAVGNGKSKDIARRMSAKLILDKYQEIKVQKKKDQKLKNSILTESIDK